jgi:hypothetical protein
VPESPRLKELAATIVSVAYEAIGRDDLAVAVLSGEATYDRTSAWTEMGLTSLTAVTFRNTAEKALKDIKLSATLVFDYPTVTDLIRYAAEQRGWSKDADDAYGSADASDDEDGACPAPPSFLPP